MRKFLSFFLVLAACDECPPVTTPEPIVDEIAEACEVRALAVCEAYAECRPGFPVESCISGNVGFCTTAGDKAPTMERAITCANEIEQVDTCTSQDPEVCMLRAWR